MSAPCVETPSLPIDADLVGTLIGRGGYTHPLFTQDDPPLPGQAVLLLMGGLVEQSGALDHAIAMLELREVRFRSMLRAGATLRVTLEPGDARVTSSGRVVRNYHWTGVDGDGNVVVEATAVMLMNGEDRTS